MDLRTSRTIMSPGLALPGPHPGARPGVEAHRRVPGGLGLSPLCMWMWTRTALPTKPDWAQPKMVTWARLTVGSPPIGRSMRGRQWVECGLGSSQWRGRGLNNPIPWTKTLAIGTWNVISLGGKEPELVHVREVERYRLEIVGLTSTQQPWAPGTQLLERGWTLHYSGVAQSAHGIQDTLGRRSMIDFVVVSSDLWPYVLDTQGKERG
ncbi:hypothetical protein L3Q82_008806 [Scortum barcoo]|uniref:Uncharacterized protein n=1 Tax=Scortum barcoo TaxID=214431 RepID=A0ACB8XDL2_9TELE|nr:hypothetical protein L3Q82_008806 [Scortum barcoo]